VALLGSDQPISDAKPFKEQRPPLHVPIHRWRQFLNDCTKFLASGSLAERAAALGWDAVALFGWCRHRPLDHSGGAGLLWVNKKG
jgi:hypothetical protein